MPYARKQRRPGSASERRYWLPILAMSCLASMPILAQESTTPSAPPSTVSWADLPASTLLTIQVEGYPARETTLGALQAAIGKQIDRCVQAAVAEERGAAAADRVELEAGMEAQERTGRAWRAVALIAAGAGTGSLADGGQGALYGAAGGAVSALIWWIVERWPLRPTARPSP